MPLVLGSSPIRVVIEEHPWTITIHAAGVELACVGPLTFLTEPRWRPGPNPPPDGDPPHLPDEAWHRLSRIEHAEHSDECHHRFAFHTDHPAPYLAEVAITIHPDAGTVTLRNHIPHAAVTRQAFRAEPGERWYGFGERSHASSLGRGVIENYVGEGPYQPHEYPFLGDIVPPWGIRNRPDATYFPIPWVLSTRGYGVLVERDEVSYERFRTAGDDDQQWSIEVESPHLDYTVFAGPSTLEALGRFIEQTGRQPAPERWWFGPWYQTGHANHVPLEEEARQAATLEAARGASSAIETHCRYLPLGEDRGFEQEEVARTEHAHQRGLAALSYLNPLLGREYAVAFEEAQAKDALIRNQAGETYLFQAYVGGREPPHTLETQYDFTHPAAHSAWAAIADKIAAAGYDGWMEDFGEYTPLDARLADGTTGTAAHNRYPTLYHRAAAAVAEELEAKHGRRFARFVRSGWTGSAASSPIVWGGDPTTSWGFDGLASAVTEGLSMGASGVAMWGSDTGGFLSTLDQLTPDLLIRWIQFSAFCPVMRTKAGGIEIPAYDRPQVWDEDILPAWCKWSRWHTRLNDYLMAAHATYRRIGRPIMCSLELAYPGTGPVEDQYLFGPDLLVAPILEPGATGRPVVLPEGRWFDLFDPSGTRCHDGPATIHLDVGPEDIPVLVRAGAVIALLPEDVRSLSPYAAPLSSHRQILAWPDSAPSSNTDVRLGPNHRAATSWSGDEWTLRVTGPSDTRWDVEVRHPTKAHSVRLEGRDERVTLRMT